MQNDEGSRFHVEHYKSLCLVVSSIKNDHYYAVCCECLTLLTTIFCLLKLENKEISVLQ